MLSTLSLLIPTALHTNLARLHPRSTAPSAPGAADPGSLRDPSDESAWRPGTATPSTSATTTPSSQPGTPRRAGRGHGAQRNGSSDGSSTGFYTPGTTTLGFGLGGDVTPSEACDERAALVRNLRGALLREPGIGSADEGGGYGCSGIDWDSVRRGLTKISIAADETSLAPPARNTTFERAEYISGLTHLHASLPPTLTPSELTTLLSSLPPQLHHLHNHQHHQQHQQQQQQHPPNSYPRRLAKSLVLALLFLSALLLPHLLALARAALKAERRYKISSGFLHVAREARRRVVVVGTGVPAAGVLWGLESVAGAVMGGVVEGVEEGVEMLRERSERMSA